MLFRSREAWTSEAGMREALACVVVQILNMISHRIARARPSVVSSRRGKIWPLGSSKQCSARSSLLLHVLPCHAQLVLRETREEMRFLEEAELSPLRGPRALGRRRAGGEVLANILHIKRAITYANEQKYTMTRTRRYRGRRTHASPSSRLHPSHQPTSPQSKRDRKSVV